MVEPITITASSLMATGAKFSVPLLARIRDTFKPEEEILVECTSPDWKKVEFLFGCVSYERGERRTFRVRGKPGFVAEVIKQIQLNGGAFQRYLS